MIVYLIGARASGKTTVGCQLAEKLGYPFLDLDAFISQGQGQRVADIVASQGWTGFRQLESQYLRKACASAADGNLVVATGGGVAQEANNRAFMRASGKIIWINTSCDAILKRLAREPLAEQRPSLTGRPLEVETRDIVASREPIYRECCHFEVSGDEPPEVVCQSILSCLGNGGAGSGN